MLRTREIDPVASGVRACSFSGDSSRPGSLRSIAESLAAQTFDVTCVHGIDAGDALSLATRFDCGWAYRGRQALLWKPTFIAHEVHDRYLPAPLLRPFDRRGLLEVRGEFQKKPLTLIAAEFSRDRHEIRELRFLRSTLRAIDGEALVFLSNAGKSTQRIGLNDFPHTRLLVSP